MGFNDPTFWQNFWPNFWADLIVGIVIAGLISLVIKKSRKIEARILADMWHPSETEYLLVFRLRNTGKVAFKRDEIYWHLFVDGELQLEGTKWFEASPVLASKEIPDKPFYSFRGLLGSPVFPGRQADLLEIRVRAPQMKQVRLYYFLSTVYGLFPKHVRIDSDEDVLPSTLGIVETRLKQTAT